MSLPAVLFYVLAAVILSSTVLAVTRRQPMHAVLYLVVSLIATAALFALLGAPLPAVLQVVIMAGAVMVLFLFVIMLLGRQENREADPLRWQVPTFLAALVFALVSVLAVREPTAAAPLFMAWGPARELAGFVFERYWVAVEAVAVLFFVALAGSTFLIKPGAPDSGAGKSAKEGPSC